MPVGGQLIDLMSLCRQMNLGRAAECQGAPVWVLQRQTQQSGSPVTLPGVLQKKGHLLPKHAEDLIVGTVESNRI